MTSAKHDLLAIYSEYLSLRRATDLMNWDRQVLMPTGGSDSRSEHTGILSRLAHLTLTSDRFQLALDRFESDLESEVDRAIARNLRRDLKRAVCLPTELVERKSRVSNLSYAVWKQCRETGEFAPLEPHLTELFEIARETAERLTFIVHPYDALIDLYEEGTTTAEAQQMFAAIKQPIIRLVRQIESEENRVDDERLVGEWEVNQLRDFAERSLEIIGFDFKQGRLDIASNAFCTNVGTGDVRMTTRASNHIKGIVSSSLHEMGHALYEQRIDRCYAGTPIFAGVSHAVHESQSRLWENIVGRSDGFWTAVMPDLAKTFPALAGIEGALMAQMMRKVKPTFIRVGADELTYNLHILIRFELEVDLVTGTLSMKELPEAWNEKYRDTLGIVPEHNGLGCLQDVHWTRGSVGYFPTYTMGNLIGAQLWKCMQSEIGDQESNFAHGNFSQTLDWMTEKIYRHGSLYTPQDLVTRASGSSMNAEAWLAYAEERYSPKGS